MRKDIRDVLALSIGLWAIAMLWLFYTGFTLDVASVITLGVAIFSVALRQDSRISRMEAKLDIMFPVIKELLEKRIKKGKD